VPREPEATLAQPRPFSPISPTIADETALRMVHSSEAGESAPLTVPVVSVSGTALSREKPLLPHAARGKVMHRLTQRKSRLRLLSDPCFGRANRQSPRS